MRRISSLRSWKFKVGSWKLEVSARENQLLTTNYKLLTRFLAFLFIFNLFGCTTEYNLATGRQESLFYSTEREIKIGDAVAEAVERQFEINTDVDVNERVETILNRIIAVCDRRDIRYFIKVIDEDQVNAVSLPGGYIYVFKGLMDRVDNDDQLASVIAHEVGHITARHGVKRLQASYGYLLLQVLAAEAGDADFARGVQVALASIFTEYSQADEFEADRLAVKYIKKAGYDVKEVAGMLHKLKEHQDKEPPRRFSYWRTHPHLPKRIATVNQEVSGRTSYEDYMNLMEIE